jgi:hypothetical protein
LWTPPLQNVSQLANEKNPYAAALTKPSNGLEPLTPSLPSLGFAGLRWASLGFDRSAPQLLHT